MSNYLMRSLMFVPAHIEKLISKAIQSDADVLLLDLEDSVQPAVNKQLGRLQIKKFLERGDFKKSKIFVRVNDRESGHLLRDVQQLMVPGILGFVYPKSKTGEDIYFFDKLLETIEYEKGIPVGTYKIIPLIETAAAVLNAQDICRSSKRIIAIAFGCEDYLSDLGGHHYPEGHSLMNARALIAMAARANNVVPIDTVHVRVHDMVDLEKNLKIARALGFEGMLVLNPKEIPLVHAYYSPSEREVREANETLSRFAAAELENKGVAIVGNQFVGPPMVIAAKKILERQKNIEGKSK